MTSQMVLHGNPIHIDSFVVPESYPEHYEIWTAPYRCAHCQHVNIGTVPIPVDYDGFVRPETARATMAASDAELSWTPARVQAPTYQYVPERIASAAAEAYACHSVEAYRAAVILARAVIEAIAKDKGITERKSLEWKIEKLREQDMVREYVEEAAHEVRHLGNDMAHGDFEESIRQQDSMEILEFMGVVLTEVYEGPGRAKARREAREAQKVAKKT
ncbi:hypothetical protein J2S68_000354 [Glycomyces algeriensis]|uniref:DUF4145 domain-containing protein n=2 Tax=Glycomyces algeriensis TaxID=256037 RepID=UPI002492A31D|nr:DUF4145 domain-containing protein [Glycomyces algeriensis]MDR7348811.1 hypothetical protein [Glycomyces algeriensis]